MSSDKICELRFRHQVEMPPPCRNGPHKRPAETDRTMTVISRGIIVDMMGKGSHHAGHRLRSRKVVGHGDDYSGGHRADSHGEYYRGAKMAKMRQARISVLRYVSPT